MISFEEALELVLSHTSILPVCEKDIYEIKGDVLAEEIRARADVPIFSNSAMDGFALRSEDIVSCPVSLKIKGCIKAGDFPSEKVDRGGAFKIMTGAPLPPGADAVVMLEETEEREGEVIIRKSAKKGENVRFKGEEIKKGQMALEKGTILDPASVGFLAALGWQDVKVYRRPLVSLLITGSELVKPGSELGPGQIWESNSALLRQALAEVNIRPIGLGLIPDQREKLGTSIQEGLNSSDILLISGGISVGDFDFVQDILLKCSIQKIFWRVAIKPGKPVFFGKKGRAMVFGLPGNPASVLVAYLQFVRPAILKMRGYREVLLKERVAVLMEDIKKKPGRAHFLRGIFHEKDGDIYVRSAGLQHSHVLRSFSRANCLIFLEQDKKFFKKGEAVKIQILPWV